MRPLIGLLLAGVLATPAAAAAVRDPAPQLSVEQVERGLSAKPGDTCREDPATGEFTGNCPRGANFRGFNLADPEGPVKSSGKPSTTQGKRTQARRQPARATAPPAGIDMLINFKNASAELTPQARSNARVFAKALRGPTLANVRVSIDGHTNAVGAKAYNDTLSNARAAAVVDFLATEGVARDRLEPHGYGFDRPINAGNPSAPENRRVEARRLN